MNEPKYKIYYTDPGFTDRSVKHENAIFGDIIIGELHKINRVINIDNLENISSAFVVDENDNLLQLRRLSEERSSYIYPMAITKHFKKHEDAFAVFKDILWSNPHGVIYSLQFDPKLQYSRDIYRSFISNYYGVKKEDVYLRQNAYAFEIHNNFQEDLTEFTTLIKNKNGVLYGRTFQLLYRVDGTLVGFASEDPSQNENYFKMKQRVPYDKPKVFARENGKNWLSILSGAVTDAIRGGKKKFQPDPSEHRCILNPPTERCVVNTSVTGLTIPRPAVACFNHALNPQTNRCIPIVDLNKAPPQLAQPQPNVIEVTEATKKKKTGPTGKKKKTVRKPAVASSKSDCVWNPHTNRCVMRDGPIAQTLRKPLKPCLKHKYNSKTGYCNYTGKRLTRRQKERMTKKELMEWCKAKGYPGASRMTKEQLINSC